MAHLIIHNTLSGNPTLEVKGQPGSSISIPTSAGEKALVDAANKANELYLAIKKAYENGELGGGEGGSGVIIVQEPGTSTLAVMSQNAVTSLVDTQIGNINALLGTI